MVPDSCYYALRAATIFAARGDVANAYRCERFWFDRTPRVAHYLRLTFARNVCLYPTLPAPPRHLYPLELLLR